MKHLVFFIFSVISFTVYSSEYENRKLFLKFNNDISIHLNFSNDLLESNFEESFFNTLIKEYGIQSIEKAFRTNDIHLIQTYLITLKSEKYLNDLINELNKQSFIDYAEKIPIYELFLTPNDPQHSAQWNLATIQAEQAWNISTGNTNVVVAVTDDAIEISHPDLISNIWTNLNEIPNNGLDDDNNGYIDDINGWDAADNDNNPAPLNALNYHGTHVSGIVAASTNNSVGISAIGFNIKLMAVKIGTSPSGALIGAYSGLDYVISTGNAQIINMSWGGSSYSITYQNLFNAANNANIVCVAAAGNSDSQIPMYPASYNHVISVGSTTISDQKSGFSNYGNTIDVMAPGSNILSTLTNNGYGIKSGTSMASPLVAGLCGLLLSHSPSLTPAQVETCIENTCDDISSQNASYNGLLGAGRINALQALQCYNTPPTAEFTANYTNICIGQNIQFTDLSIGTSNTNWLWNFGDGNTSTLQNPTHSYSSAGPFTVTLTVTNAYGNDIEIKNNYITTSTPSAVLSGSTNIVSGGNAYLQVQFNGNPPFSFVYTDGVSNYTLSSITQNPYYFSVISLANTTYTLVSISDIGCTGSVSGSAIINFIQAPISNDTTCTNGQYILQDNGLTEAQSIAYTDDGGYVIAGYTTVSGAGQEDVFVTKFDDQNNIEWSKTYGTSNSDKGYPIYIEKTNNGYIVSSNSKAYASSLGALVILNLDLNGSIIWQKKISNSTNYSNSRFIGTDNQNNILVSGSYAFNSAGTDDAYLMKIDAINGNLIWSTTFGTNTLDHSYNTIETDDGGYLYGSHSHAFGIGTSAKLIIKVNANGQYQWAKTYDNSNNEAFYTYKLTPDGNILALGIEGNTNAFDINITKLSNTGSVIWSKNYSGLGDDMGQGLHISTNGEVYFSGYSNSFGNGNYDLFLTKLDANGNEIFTKFYGGNASENTYGGACNISVNETLNKIYLFSNTKSFGGSDLDPYIVITDLDGNSDCFSITANWTVTSENQTTANVNGTINNLGTLNNSTYLTNVFLTNLDTICNTVCDTIITPICINTNLDTAICFLDSTQINIANGSNYTWSPDYNISNINIQNPILFPTVDTTYIVSYLNDNNCFIIDTIHININENPVISSNFSDTTICPNNCVALSANGGINYTWSPGLGLSNPNISNPTACPSTSTQYIVSGTDINGCEAKDTITINVLACCGAYADFTVSDTIICVNESIMISNLSIVNNPASHTWIFNGANIASSNLQNPLAISYNTAGVYQILYILNDACGIDSVYKTIYVNNIPEITLSNDTFICGIDTINYLLSSAEEIIDYTYSWLPTMGLNNSNILNAIATVSSTSSYILEVQDNFSLCINWDTINIFFQNLPNQFITINSNFCIDDTAYFSSTFSFDSILWNGINYQNNFTLPITNDTIIFAEGFIGNCAVTDSFSVIALAKPNLQILTPDTSICVGDSLIIYASSDFPILWANGTNADSIQIIALSDTILHINSTNISCNISDSISINTLALPSVNISGNDTACINSLLNLSASGAINYTWLNADNMNGNQNTLTLTQDTIIYVIGEDGCVNSDSLMIYAIDSNYVEIVALDSICVGENITLLANSNASVLWNTGETNNTIQSTLFTNTSFTIITTSPYCAQSFDSVYIYALTYPNLAVVTPIEVNYGEEIVLNANGGNNYFWYPNNNLSCTNCESPSLTATESTVYYVTLEENGCEVSDSINIIVNALDECILLPTAFSPNNDNVNDLFYPISKVNDINIEFFRIYNRWGELIHNDIQPWDGKYKNINQPLETYIYFVKYKCNGEYKILKGNVTLIR